MTCSSSPGITRGSGQSGSAVCTITVTAPALSVTLNKTGTVEVSVGGSVSVSAAASGGSGAYAYSWQSSTGIGWAQIAAGQTLNFTGFNQSGVTYTIRCVVTDDAGSSAASEVLQVRVTGSSPIETPAL